MTDAEHHDRLRGAFHRVIAADAAERDHVLAAECQEGPDLRDELESLLRHVDHGDDLERAATGWRASHVPSASVRPPHHPDHIGRYRLLRRIGSGATGSVHLAEQDRPRRTVAVKVLDRALATGRSRARFELESEILGRLDHPGIASILEAGCDDGHPYFVMEYVDGCPITTHVVTEGIDLRGRVRLLIDLCTAVAHANQRGVIHRDLKPANILVTPCGRVRVLDFGIARLSGDDRPAMRTRAGELMGTLAYMSPEQLDGDPDVDVRADVYAIGALAYELLSGHPVVQLDDTPLPAAIQRAREHVPTPLGQLRHGLAGDLEIIVGKALRRSRVERYANVVELGEDLSRWLDHEPIRARVPGTLYQLRRFARRNRSLVAAGAAAFLLLLAAVIVVSIALGAVRDQARVASDATASATEQRDAARLANDATRRQRDAFLSVLAFSDLDRESSRRLAATTANEGDLDTVLAQAFAARGWFVDARLHALRAIDRISVAGDPLDDELEQLHEMLWVSVWVDRASKFALRDARWREVNGALLARNDPELAALVASLEQMRPDSWSRQYDADAFRRQAAVIAAAAHRRADDDLAVQLLADRLEWNAFMISGRSAHEDSLLLMQSALTMRRRHLLETAPRVLWGRAMLVDILLRGSRYAEAEGVARRALDDLEPILPADHVLLAMFRARQGRALIGQGADAEALAALRAALPPLRAGRGSVAHEVRMVSGEVLALMARTGDTEGADAVRGVFLEAITGSPHRIRWTHLAGRLGVMHADLEAAARAALTTRDPADVAVRFGHLFDSMRGHGLDEGALGLAVANAVRAWMDIWLDSGGWSTVSQPVLDELDRLTRRADAHPLLRAEVCIFGIVHASRASDLDRAAAFYREGIAAIESSDGMIEWGRPYLESAWGEALLHAGRAGEARPRLAAAAAALAFADGEESYNTQLVRATESVARHADLPADRALAFDADRLRAALAEAAPQPRVLLTGAWSVARTTGHPPEIYAAAVEAATRAEALLPGSWAAARALAMADLRVGRWAESRTMARRTRERLPCDRPEIAAIEAMALVHLDRGAAREALDRAMRLMDHPEFSRDLVAAALVAEARAIVGTRE